MTASDHTEEASGDLAQGIIAAANDAEAGE